MYVITSVFNLTLRNLLFLNLQILILFLYQHLSINLFLRICCLASSFGVQGMTLVSNSMSFSDIASKSILSKVPVTSTSYDLNSNKKSYYSLSCLDITSKSFYLKFLKQTSCNIKSSDKSYSWNCFKVFSKPIITDRKYSPKTEYLLLLEDGFCLMDQLIAQVFTQVNMMLLHIGKKHHI